MSELKTQWGYQPVSSRATERFELQQKNYFVPYLPVESVPRDSLKYYICGEDYFRDICDSLQQAKESVYLTGLHFMRDFGLKRPDYPVADVWQPGDPVLVIDKEGEPSLHEGTIAKVHEGLVHYDVSVDGRVLERLTADRICDPTPQLGEAPDYFLGNVLYDIASRNPELKIFLLVNQFWTNENLLNWQISSSGVVDLHNLVQYATPFIPDWLEKVAHTFSTSTVVGKLTAELGKGSISTLMWIQRKMPVSLLRWGLSKARKQIALEGGLLGYMKNTWFLFEKLASLPNVVCRTAIHPAEVMHSHHQKTVVIDHEVAYYGGIDMTYIDGDRWDRHGNHDVLRRHVLGRTEKFWHDIGGRATDPRVVRYFVENIFARWKKGHLRKLKKYMSLEAVKEFLEQDNPEIAERIAQREHEILVQNKQDPEFAGFIVSVKAEKEPGAVPYLNEDGSEIQPLDEAAVEGLRYEHQLHEEAQRTGEPPQMPLVQVARSMPQEQYPQPAWNKARARARWEADPELARYNHSRHESLRGWDAYKGPEKETWGTEWEYAAKEAYLNGIHLAEHYIYFENQWISDNDLWKALLEAARKHADNPDFRLIMALPTNPLAAANYGIANTLGIGDNWSQEVFAKKIREHLGPDRFGIYSVDQPYRPYGQAYDVLRARLFECLRNWFPYSRDPADYPADDFSEEREAALAELGPRLLETRDELLGMLDELAAQEEARASGTFWYGRHAPYITEEQVKALLESVRPFVRNAADIDELKMRVRSNINYILELCGAFKRLEGGMEPDQGFRQPHTFLSLITHPQALEFFRALPGNWAQVYVHSKIMVVDDIWAICGSANAGGISLHGAVEPTKPDTEIATVIVDEGSESLPARLARDIWAGWVGEVSTYKEAADAFRREADERYQERDPNTLGARSYVSYHSLHPEEHDRATVQVGSNPTPDSCVFEVEEVDFDADSKTVTLKTREHNLIEIWVEYWERDDHRLDSDLMLARNTEGGRQRVDVEGQDTIEFQIPPDLDIANAVDSIFEGDDLEIWIKVYAFSRSDELLFSSFGLFSRMFVVPKSYFESPQEAMPPKATRPDYIEPPGRDLDADSSGRGDAVEDRPVEVDEPPRTEIKGITLQQAGEDYRFRVEIGANNRKEVWAEFWEYDPGPDPDERMAAVAGTNGRVRVDVSGVENGTVEVRLPQDVDISEASDWDGSELEVYLMLYPKAVGDEPLIDSSEADDSAGSVPVAWFNPFEVSNVEFEMGIRPVYSVELSRNLYNTIYIEFWEADFSKDNRIPFLRGDGGRLSREVGRRESFDFTVPSGLKISGTTEWGEGSNLEVYFKVFPTATSDYCLFDSQEAGYEAYEVPISHFD